jgi:hypothetical protein
MVTFGNRQVLESWKEAGNTTSMAEHRFPVYFALNFNGSISREAGGIVTIIRRETSTKGKHNFKM